MAFYSIMSIRRVRVRRKKTMLCHVWLIISKRWVIFKIPSWESLPFVHTITEVRKMKVLYRSSFGLLRLDVFQK